MATSLPLTVLFSMMRGKNSAVSFGVKLLAEISRVVARSGANLRIVGIWCLNAHGGVQIVTHRMPRPVSIRSPSDARKLHAELYQRNRRNRPRLAGIGHASRRSRA